MPSDKEAPRRIFLLDYGTDECTWCEDDSPSGEDHSPVAYVRRDTIASQVAAAVAEERARIAALQEALDQYGSHTPDCEVHQGGCICGYADYLTTKDTDHGG